MSISFHASIFQSVPQIPPKLSQARAAPAGYRIRSLRSISISYVFCCRQHFSQNKSRLIFPCLLSPTLQFSTTTQHFCVTSSLFALCTRLLDKILLHDAHTVRPVVQLEAASQHGANDPLVHSKQASAQLTTQNANTLPPLGQLWNKLVHQTQHMRCGENFPLRVLKNGHPSRSLTL
jgi:hypothetical protein